MASGKLGHSVYDLWFLAWDTLCRSCVCESRDREWFGHRGTAGASVHTVEMKTCHLWLEAAVALLTIAAVLVYADSRTGGSVVCNAWGEHSLIRALTFTDASVH
ncbi:hypothetical protein ALC60_07885 [Trachymyrmex zeteki]|uniref:Uncharacterized protein n=1 Tax=Mycetomoellerius zeteki TaxID=64791 RepID=A0A151WZP9_9HYME|nr:hypothetical protein ALC60_07885 [Trachymyrmex zeteki]